MIAGIENKIPQRPQIPNVPSTVNAIRVSRPKANLIANAMVKIPMTQK